ncbi:MAG: hypothetical protein WBA23_25565 [Tunicatimonas sp.]|uniref:hypothetical protein n=1 Tax=Tunicatimonas sp. TaxID=1940096 RepID=UPI003C70B0B7
MKHFIWILLFNCHFVSGQSSDTLVPPKSLAVTDTVFAKIIHDPFRGLENLASDETQAWIDQKNQ